MTSGAMIARILTQYSDKGSTQARKDVKKLGADFDKFARRAKVAFGVAAAASAAFAVKVGVDSVKAAMEDQKSQALLANSLRNTVGATDAAIASVERHISKQQLLIGVTDEHPIDVLCRSDDQRVQHHDVCHREERDESATNFTAIR